jgi:Ca2+-binding RTX toxin-like protein
VLRAAGLLSVAVCWFLVGASQAVAAVASVSAGALTFTAAPGEVNELRLQARSDGGPEAVFVAVVDQSSALTAGSGCTSLDAHAVRCDPFTSATVSLGDMDDLAEMTVDYIAQQPTISAQIDGGEGNDRLGGGAQSDNVAGGPGNDSIGGWEGADSLIGGPGDDGFDLAECSGSPCTPNASADSVVGGTGIDSATYGQRESAVTATLDGVANDGAPGERDNVGADVENLEGGNGQDVLSGSEGPNAISGGVGDGAGAAGDTLNGFGGDDVLGVNNSVRGTLNGGDGDDSLYRGRQVNGGAGNDLIQPDSGGYPAAMTLSGGSGVDSVSYVEWSMWDPLTISLDDVANDGVVGFAADNVRADIENVIGGGGSDTLVGSAADNRLDGGYGSDTISGAQGTDTVDYGDGSVGVDVSLDGIANDGPELDNVHADVEIVLGTDGDDRLIGSSADNTLDGGGGNDVLFGGPGSDLLLGGAGADRLRGGSDADHLAGGGGEDTADYSERVSAVTVTLDGLPGSGNVSDGPAASRDRVDGDVEDIRSGSGDDVLTASAQDNVLDGGLGNDELHGLGGTDTVDYATRSADLFIQLGGPSMSGAADEDDDIAGDVENAIGGSGDDLLIGSSAPNELQGRGGDDVLDGMAGRDDLRGGDGFDWASYRGRLASVFADLDGVAGDDGEAGEHDSLSSDIEALEGGAGNDVLTGDAADNALDGGAGADQLSGGGGFDAVDYSYRTDGVTADADGAAGDDGQPGEGDTIATDVEDLYGGAGADTLSGNASDNVLFGGASADRLDGGAGEDALFGQDGDDDLTTRDDDADFASCGAGDDLVRPDALDEVQDCERSDIPPPPAPQSAVPQPAPPPAAQGAPDTLAPTIFAKVLRQRLARVRRSGLRFRLSCSEPCTFDARLVVDARSAKRLGLKSRVLGTARGRIATGAKSFVLRLDRAARTALSRRHSLRATLQVSAKDAAGNTRTKRLLLRLT